MKIPDRIIGFLDLKDSKFPYEFDKNSFELKLYYPTEKEAYENILSGLKIYGVDFTEHKWVDEITIVGKTSENYWVYFGTSANPVSYNGYSVYNVDWYYITDVASELIDEIRFYGQEIDYFYNPSRVFKQELKFEKNKICTSKSMHVQTITSKALDCGTYKSGESTIEVTCKAFAIMNPNSASPLDSKSYLSLKFSEQLGVKTFLFKARCVHQLLKYVCYRDNVDVADISTYLFLEEGKTWNTGKLVFKSDNSKEDNPKAKGRIIQADVLNNRVADLLDIIEKDEITFGHICGSVQEMSCYTVSRIIMILTAFEREFRNIYGQDVKRSDEYKETKSKVVDLVNEYANSLHGKTREYVKGFAKGIRNHDASYGENVKYALEDCRCIMEPFVTKRFKGTYEEIIEEVSININDIRNGIAHSKLDFDIEARSITEIKFVEMLLYAMRLKNMCVDIMDIQRSINDLFDQKTNLSPI